MRLAWSATRTFWPSTSMLPPWPLLPLTVIWALPSTVALPLACSTTRPPCTLTCVACTLPLRCSELANSPTASPCKVPRLRAWLPGACTCSVMPSRPRPVTSTLWPAARMTAPLGACSNALCAASTLGAMSTRSPLRATMLPCTTMLPTGAVGLLLPKCRRPARASASLMPTAAAVKAAVSTTAPAPTAMPLWFTSTTWPLLDRVPKISDGVFVTTRLMDRLPALGCRICVLLPAGMVKLCQLMEE